MDLYLPGIQNFVVALVPMILGMIWFHPKVFGSVWMKAAGLKEEDAKSANMALLMAVGYVLALVITMYLKSYAIYHEGDVNDQTFVHGAFHASLFALMIALPVMVSSTLWELKPLSYYLINCAYWLVTFALMGGILFIWRSGYAETYAKMTAAG